MFKLVDLETLQNNFLWVLNVFTFFGGRDNFYFWYNFKLKKLHSQETTIIFNQIHQLFIFCSICLNNHKLFPPVSLPHSWCGGGGQGCACVRACMRACVCVCGVSPLNHLRGDNIKVHSPKYFNTYWPKTTVSQPFSWNQWARLDMVFWRWQRHKNTSPILPVLLKPLVMSCPLIPKWVLWPNPKQGATKYNLPL